MSMTTTYPPTPAERALADATITVGGIRARLDELTHSIALYENSGVLCDPFAPAVRVFTAGREAPRWLEEHVDDNDVARQRTLQITRLLQLAHGTYYPHRCVDCDKIDRSCLISEVTRKLVALSLCHECNYWHDIIDSVNADAAKTSLPRGAVVDGRVYVVKPMSQQPAQLRGFGGMHKRVRWLDGSLDVESNDMWNGSVVPERYRELLPDTAEFVSVTT